MIGIDFAQFGWPTTSPDNIYASNDSEKHATFWQWMVNEFPNAPWLFYGDFNMVECHEDKEGVLPVSLPTREKEA